MSPPCDRIQKDAAGLVSLGPDDPERRAAEAHAATCASCTAALAEAKAVLALVDRALPLAAPSTGGLARARLEILRDLAAGAHHRFNGVAGASRAGRSPVVAAAVLGAVLAASWFIPASKHLAHGGPALRSALLAVAAAAIALATLLWNRRLLGLLPACSLAVAAIAGGGVNLQAAIGARCASLELALAVAPSALVLLFARSGRVGHPTLTVAAAAGAGALVGQAVLHLACHAVPSIAHSMVFHSLPVLVALGLGALLGRSFGRRPALP